MSTTEAAELKSLIKAAVAEAFVEQQERLQEMIVDAVEDVGFTRAMEEADEKLADPVAVERILKGRGES